MIFFEVSLLTQFTCQGLNKWETKILLAIEIKNEFKNVFSFSF